MAAEKSKLMMKRRLNDRQGYAPVRARLRAAVWLLIAVLLLCGCTKEEERTGTLTVGVRRDIANFGYYNRNTGKHYGLEIDLAKELARRLGYATVTYVSVDPDDREERLDSGDVDCLIACYTITEERQERFDISSPYYTDKVVIMVEKSSMIENAAELADKKIGVRQGSTTALQITEALYHEGIIEVNDAESCGVEFCTMETYDSLVTALEEGVIDAVGTDGCILQQYLTQEREYVDLDISNQSYGVAMKKGSALTGKIENAIQEICADGTMEALADKWK